MDSSVPLAAVRCSTSQALWSSVRQQHLSILIAVPTPLSQSHQATSVLAHWLAAGRARVCCCNHHSTHDPSQSTRSPPLKPLALVLVGGALDLHFSITRMNTPRDRTRASERTTSFCLFQCALVRRDPTYPTASLQQRKAYHLDLDQCVWSVEDSLQVPPIRATRTPSPGSRSRNHSPEFFYLPSSQHHRHVFPR